MPVCVYCKYALLPTTVSMLFETLSARIRRHACENLGLNNTCTLYTLNKCASCFAPFPMQSSLHLRLYKQRAAKMLSKDEFLRPDSCIALGSSVVQPPTTSLNDLVAEDLCDIPRLLAKIRSRKVSSQQVTLGRIRSIILYNVDILASMMHVPVLIPRSVIASGNRSCSHMSRASG